MNIYRAKLKSILTTTDQPKNWLIPVHTSNEFQKLSELTRMLMSQRVSKNTPMMLNLGGMIF